MSESIKTWQVDCTITVPVQFRSIGNAAFDLKVCGLTSLFDNLNEQAKLDIYRQIKDAMKDGADETL